ncbi:hypothetical protein [Lysinibacillus sp. Ag94]|uniref:hypothetical protein n=1 Tax=Lysinibacillus sp. Ag94 TaxID=2936682 RepID=UPI00200EFB41|nr:hypothetical protein [Lysinibacillus sp. Ag94]UPW82742.1 hypothetical protein MY533_18805 [Lysinibacillus sp. Ag94]
MQTVKILFQILFIMYWVVLGLLILFKIYTPPRSILATAFIMTGILMALLIFARMPITKVYIHNH